MSKFILVHEVPSSNPIVLHEEELRVIRKSDQYGGSTEISCTVYENIIAEPFIHVAETPEKIFEMLK